MQRDIDGRWNEGANKEQPHTALLTTEGRNSGSQWLLVGSREVVLGNTTCTTLISHLPCHRVQTLQGRHATADSMTAAPDRRQKEYTVNSRAGCEKPTSAMVVSSASIGILPRFFPHTLDGQAVDCQACLQCHATAVSERVRLGSPGLVGRMRTNANRHR